MRIYRALLFLLSFFIIVLVYIGRWWQVQVDLFLGREIEYLLLKTLINPYTFLGIALFLYIVMQSVVYIAFISVLLVLIYLQDPLFAEIVHIPLYMAVGFLTLLSFRKNIIVSLLYIIALILFDEVLQWLHPQRFFDTRDIIINLSSALIGLIIAEGKGKRIIL